MRIAARFCAFSVVLTASALLVGCQSADYSADIRNQTPQPLLAQLYSTEGAGGHSPILAQTRLGPGDRGVVGPVRAHVGTVGLAVDTTPNPGAPVMIDLRPGLNVFNVTQVGDKTAGPLQVRNVTP